MSEQNSAWQSESLTRRYLEGVRGAIPLAAEQIELMLAIIAVWCPAPRHVIDLGCGDGIIGRAILDRFPGSRLVFVDFSSPMLDALRAKLPSSASVEILETDYATSAWLRRIGHEQDVDVVVSGFSIHHQPDTRKRMLYAEIFELLASPGVFLNLEHVSSPSQAIESIWDEIFVDYLYAFHQESGSDETSEAVAERYYKRPDKSENLLASVEAQCDWLLEIGFVDVDCYFKIFELALFGGRKP